MSVGDDLPDLLTVKEVAKFLRVSVLTIKRWGKKGILPPIRINARGDRRYKKEAVLRLIGETAKKTEEKKKEKEEKSIRPDLEPQYSF